jgi:hypothetical protein
LAGESRTYNNFKPIFSTRIPFEALANPESYLGGKNLTLQEPHPYSMSETEFQCRWDGSGDPLYKKMVSNFLAEVPEFFLERQNFKTISSLEEQSPEFGNAIAGSHYLMRIKMSKSREKPNISLSGFGDILVNPPQDVTNQTGFMMFEEVNTVRETLTMYSRPTAFGPPTHGDGGTKNLDSVNMRLGSSWGFNFPYTPPYYHGDAWCDLIFYAEETKKYTLEEILSSVSLYPYYTRYWNPLFNDALRDLTGYRADDTSGFTGWIEPTGSYQNYSNSPWYDLINSSSLVEDVSPIDTGIDIYEWLNKTSLEDTGSNTIKWATPANTSYWLKTGPQSPVFVNENAMQLDSSVNLFGKGTVRKINLDGDATSEMVEVASDQTVRGKTRWIIQPKFETPILNFNKYDNLSDEELKCTEPEFAKSQVPRGMWHQYGEIPSENEGVYLQVEDIPDAWLRGALGIERGNKNIKSLADLVGFKKDPVRLGETADTREILTPA